MSTTTFTRTAKPVLRFSLVRSGRVTVTLERRSARRRWVRVGGRPLRARGRRGRNAVRLAPWLRRVRLARGGHRLVLRAAGDRLVLPARVR